MIFTLDYSTNGIAGIAVKAAAAKAQRLRTKRQEKRKS
jgi:hypothetical protein